jgi:hypothetical protein
MLYSQFQVAMLFEDSTLLDRMFRVFDKNDDNVVTFAEYVECLSVISSKGTKEDKTKCKNQSDYRSMRRFVFFDCLFSCCLCFA